MRLKRLMLGTVLMVLWVCSLLVLPGCGGASEAKAQEAQVPRELSFVIVNNSGGDIRSIGLQGANIPMSFRAMAKGKRSEIKNKKLKLPEQLTLHWSDRRGDRYEGSVHVWGELGASYSGPVKLTITRRNKVVLSGG